jgi:hypothetical protein
MQVVSAPLIVLTTYYMVNPDSRASTIALSFAAGFSSETVLLLIRAMVDKLKPAPSVAAASAPAVRVQPDKVDFGSVATGSSLKKPVVIVNGGSEVLNISAISCSGEFSTAASAPLQLAIGAKNTIDVTFNPVTRGALNGELTIADDAPGSPRRVALTGTGR